MVVANKFFVAEKRPAKLDLRAERFEKVPTHPHPAQHSCLVIFKDDVLRVAINGNALDQPALRSPVIDRREAGGHRLRGRAAGYTKGNPAIGLAIWQLVQ